MSRPAWPNGASFSTGAAATRAYDPEDYPTYAAPSTVGTGVTSPLRAHHNGTVLSKNGSTPRPASSLYLPNKKLKKSRRSCRGGLTKLEACLVALCLLLLAVLLGLSIFWLIILEGYRIFTEGFPTWENHRTLLPYAVNGSDLWQNSGSQKRDRPVCTSRECALIAGMFTANLNEQIDPCEDFYEFACGSYELRHDLSPNKPMRHTIGDVTARVNKQVKSLLEAPHDPTDKPWDRLAKSYYQKCLQEEVLDQNGISALVMILNELGGWPVLEGDMWQPWTHSWEQQLALLINRTGINAVVLEFAVGHDPKNSSTTVIEIDQPKWGIGTRWPYLSGADDPMIKNYTQLMIEIAIGIGADPAIAARDMREAVELEVKLVNFSADEQMRRDADRVYNPFQLYQLAEIFPYVDLEEYVRTIFRDSVDITLNDTVIVREVEYIRGIQHVMQSSSKRTIANYLLWRSVQGFSPFLPPWLREPFYKFRANQTGIFTNTPPERWEDCVTLSVMMLDMPVGKLFVQHFFDKEKAMTKMDELTLYLKETFIEELHNIDWMDDKTKQRAVDKANFIEYKSGYPPWLFNDTWMQDNWGLTPTNRTEPLLHLTIRLKLSRVRDELVRFKQTVDRSVWYQGPAQVDAYYAPNLNQMIFPAGIMQFPFLTIGVPNYVTFGMAGAVVGHEVSHAFDDQGGRYDEFGNLEDWWARETAVKFYEKTECFVKQYESISVPEAGIRLNGRMSLGENIADNGGVKTAYMAYNKWLESSGGVEPALPGLQNFTSDQLFFLAYANTWCSIVRPKYYMQIIMTDVHAPPKYRAMVPLKNREQFAKAYQCKPGSPMNPVEKCAVW